MDRENKILEVYKALAKFVIYGAKGQPPLWPFSIVETNWYYTKFFPKEIYVTLKSLEEREVNGEEVARLCWGPSALSHWFYIVEPAFGDTGLNPFEGLTKEEGIDFLEKTIDIISDQRKGDIFCRDGENVIFDKTEVSGLLQDKEFIKISGEPKTDRVLRELVMTVWHYAILIQVGHRSYSHEFHGPYSLDNDRTLLIKDFFNLKPGEDADKLVWNFSARVPCSKIRVLEIYSNADVQIDMFNHFKVAGKLEKFCLLVDGAMLDVKEVGDLLKGFGQALSEGNQVIRRFSKLDWVRKLIDLKYVWLKPHKDILGQDWRPPESVYALVDQVGEAERVSGQFEKNIFAMAKSISPDELVDKVARAFADKIR